MSRIDEARIFLPVRIAILTVSDTREASNDTSGDTLAGRISQAGHILADRGIERDEVQAIAARLRGWIERPDIDVVINTGGTGVTGARCNARGVFPCVGENHRGFRRAFSYVELRQDRHQHDAIPRSWRRCGGDVFVCAARKHGRPYEMVGTTFSVGSSTLGIVPVIWWSSCRAPCRAFGLEICHENRLFRAPHMP